MDRLPLRRAIAVVAFTAFAFLVTATATGASSAARGDTTATLTMTQDGQQLSFVGASKVKSGSQLLIHNDTDPSDLGPHTFTLIEKGSLPKTKAEIKKCQKLKTALCQAIVKAHKVDIDTGDVGRRSVDSGKTGWDKPFGTKGDSWLSGPQGDEESRVVSAEPGTTLYYFCIVHPEMNGKLKVK